jgi:hypothetical protein
VCIVSGGLATAVPALSTRSRSRAATCSRSTRGFDADGGYAGFDETLSARKSGGKIEVVARDRACDARPLCLVGDGATDLGSGRARRALHRVRRSGAAART